LTNPLLGVVAGNIEEAPYYVAGHVELLPDGTRVRFDASVVAVNDPAAPGETVINGTLVRIDLADPAVGAQTYTFTDPWNATANTVTIADGQTRGIFDNSIEALPPSFASAMTGPVQAFIGNGTGGCLGGGFLGDAVTEAPLAADGPGAGVRAFTISGGTGASAINFTSNLFSVEGKLFAPAAAAAGGFAVERGTISGSGARAVGTLIATTNLGDAMRITGIAGTTLATPIPMAADLANGRFFANFPVGNITGLTNIPVDVQVLSAGAPVVALAGTQALMEDIVSVRSAAFSLRTGVLTVSASSSIPGTRAAPGATLTVTGTDENGVAVGSLAPTPIVGRSLRVSGLTVPPSYVTVSSSRGGSLTVPVTIR
jgi:hypothetical protein